MAKLINTLNVPAPAGYRPTKTVMTFSTVNGKTIHTSELSEWDDCPSCVFGQVHAPANSNIYICLDGCGFESAPNL